MDSPIFIKDEEPAPHTGKFECCSCFVGEHAGIKVTASSVHNSPSAKPHKAKYWKVCTIFMNHCFSYPVLRI